MIKCWGIKFKNVQELFEHPRCYVSSVFVLRNRLRTLPPEEAVLPACIWFCGKKYRSIYHLHHYGCGASMAIATLYQRLGLVLNGKKVTPEQATCPKIWDRLKQMKKSGKYATVLEFSDNWHNIKF